MTTIVERVKGLRTVHKYEVADYAAAWGAIPVPEKQAIIDAWVSKRFRDQPIAGVKVWTEKEPF